MVNYFIAFTSKTRKSKKSVEHLAEAIGYFKDVVIAKIEASQMSALGYKNVTVFKHDGINPFEKNTVNLVSWNYILENKV